MLNCFITILIHARNYFRHVIRLVLILGGAGLAPFTTAATSCDDNPVFAFSRALYLEQYSLAQSYIPRIERERNRQEAQFLAQVLAFKQAYDQQDVAQQQAVLERIERLLSRFEEEAGDSPAAPELLMLGNMMIHTARMHLALTNLLRATRLAGEGKALLDRAALLTGDDDTGLLAEGLYQYYMASDDDTLGWMLSWFAPEGDRNRGISMMERALQRAPDHAFEALRSLMFDVNWNRSDTCRYLSLMEQIQPPEKGAITHRQLLTAGYLFCGHPEAALEQIETLDNTGNGSGEAPGEAQHEWFQQARLQALAAQGEVEKLKKFVDSIAVNDGQHIRQARFALARALDTRKQHDQAVAIYRMVAKGSSDDIYARLAQRYKEFPWRAPEPFEGPSAKALRFACQDD